MSLAVRAAVITLAAWVGLVGALLCLPAHEASAVTSPARRVLSSVRAQGGGACDLQATISSSKLILFLDSDVGVTAASGRVSDWEDQSTAGNDFASGGGDRPFLVAGLDGHDALQGQDDQKMSRVSDTFADLTAGEHPELYVIVEYDEADADFGALIEITDTSVGDGLALFKTDGDALEGRAQLEGGGGFPDTATWGDFDSPTGNIFLYNLRVVLDDGVFLYVNGVHEAGPGFFPGDGMDLDMANARIFNSAGSEPLNGDIYLIVLTDDALTSTERTDFEACVDERYPSIGLIVWPAAWRRWRRRRRDADSMPLAA